MLTGLLARRWCKSPKPFVYDNFVEKKPWFDKDQRLLTLHDFTPPIIFYAQFKVYKLPLKIKLWALLKAWSPRVLLSLSFSFSGWFPGAQGPFAFTFLPGLLRHTGEGAQSGAPSAIWKGACGLCEQSKSRAGALLAFCVNQGISASFLSSIFLTAKFFPYLFLYFYPFHQCHHPEGIPGSNLVWTPVGFIIQIPLQSL